jgi:hypothetical protein
MTSEDFFDLLGFSIAHVQALPGRPRSTTTPPWCCAPSPNASTCPGQAG